MYFRAVFLGCVIFIAHVANADIFTGNSVQQDASEALQQNYVRVKSVTTRGPSAQGHLIPGGINQYTVHVYDPHTQTEFDCTLDHISQSWYPTDWLPCNTNYMWVRFPKGSNPSLNIFTIDFRRTYHDDSLNRVADTAGYLNFNPSDFYDRCDSKDKLRLECKTDWLAEWTVKFSPLLST